MQHVYLAQINPQDYPDYVALTGSGPSSDGTPNALDRPGLHLAEHHALRGVRYAAGVGYLAVVLYFYGYHRPRLPFADRPLAKLHHFFYPSAGYTTPVGLLGGLAYGAYGESQRLSEDAVMATKAMEKKAATTAFEQHRQRRAAAERRLASREPWWVSLTVKLGLAKDEKPEMLRRMNLGDTAGASSWDGFVKPYSMLWVEQRSRRVHDERFYRGPLPSSCVLVAKKGEESVAETPPATPTGAVAGGKGKTMERSRRPPHGPTPPSPPAHACYTKDQVDGLVSNVLTLKDDNEEARWTRTGGRFSLYGMVTMLIAWNQGNLAFRICMGLGAGTVAGAVLSAMKLDDIWTHV